MIFHFGWMVYKSYTDTSGNVPSGLSELAFDTGNGLENFYGKTKMVGGIPLPI